MLHRVRVWLLCVFLGSSVAVGQDGESPVELPVDRIAELPGSIVARDVIVQAGEDFYSLAGRELGSPGLAPHLAEFNNRNTTASLEAGDVVRIPLYVTQRNESARVLFVKGTVLRNGAPLTRDAEVLLNERIEAGSDGFVSLLFSTGTVVNLQPGSVVVLVRLNCQEEDDSCLIELDTNNSDMNADVESRSGQRSDFRISTPFASAAVRGTEFDFATADQEARVSVTDGSIAVEAGDESVEVSSGFGLVSREGEPLGLPVQLLPPPAFRYVPTRAATGDELVWFPLTDSTGGYSADVSNDIEGDAVVASFTVDATRTGITDVAAGEYFLNLRGLDANGIMGFPSATRITVAEIDASVTPVETRITRENAEIVVSVVDPPEDAPGFEIQIASNAEFDVPLSVDVGNQGTAVFRIDADVIFARARILVDPLTVSAFGDVDELR